MHSHRFSDMKFIVQFENGDRESVFVLLVRCKNGMRAWILREAL